MSDKEFRPTLAQLRTFVTIAENRHFGTAAAKLNLSQPSLSQALSTLENGLGVQLIERSTRRVIVTPTGERLLPFARNVLEAADSFLSHSRGAQGTLRGPLGIGMIPTVAPYLLPQLLPRMKAEYPELQTSILEDRTEPLLESLRDGRSDVIIVAAGEDHAGITEVPLYQEDFILVIPEGHELAGRENLPLSCLQDLNLLLLGEGHCLHDQVVDLCRRAEANPSSVAGAVTRASSLTTVVELVAAGLGSTLVPRSAIPAESNRPGLATATFGEGTSAFRSICMAHRTSSARAEEFSLIGDLITAAYHAVLPAPITAEYLGLSS